MACGSCKKRRMQNVKRVVNPSASKLKKTTLKPKLKSLTRADTGLRCPTCQAALRRVSRIGQGELLQCSNPRCTYVRKA